MISLKRQQTMRSPEFRKRMSDLKRSQWSALSLEEKVARGRIISAGHARQSLDKKQCISLTKRRALANPCTKTLMRLSGKAQWQGLTDTEKRALLLKSAHSKDARSKAGKTNWCSLSGYAQAERLHKMWSAINTSVGPNANERRCMRVLAGAYADDFVFVGKSKFRVAGQCPDAHSARLNVLALFHGVYWHCKPTRYAEMYYHARRKLHAWQIWAHDEDVIRRFHAAGYNVWVMWEDAPEDIEKYPVEQFAEVAV